MRGKLLIRKFAVAAICLVTLAATGCSAPATPPPPPSATAGADPPVAGATRDGSGGYQSRQFQTISGLGVNANVHSWHNGELKPAIDRIVELGDVTWRVIIDKADWEEARNPDNADHIDLDRYAAVYGSGKMADLWNTIEYIESKPGQQVMVNVMGAVPKWMGGNRIDEVNEDQWVRMVASMVAYGRTIRGLHFNLLGPMNESDWNGIEGPQVAPDQYVRLLHKLILRLDGLGLSDMRLVGPDTASTAKAAAEYIPAIAGDPLVLSRVAHFAIHTYDGDSGGTAAAVQNASRSQALDFWVTEFSGPCPGCDTGSPNPTDWPSAAATALYAIRLLQQGASGLQQYDAWDGYYEHHGSMGYWGLLAYQPDSGQYTPRKSYFVLRQLIAYTPRNSVRIEASSGHDDVPVVGLKDPISGRVTFFGVNTSDTVEHVNLSAPGIQQRVQLRSFTTDAQKNMEEGPNSTLEEGRAAYSVPAGAVFSLTGTPS